MGDHAKLLPLYTQGIQDGSRSRLVQPGPTGRRRDLPVNFFRESLICVNCSVSWSKVEKGKSPCRDSTTHVIIENETLCVCARLFFLGRVIWTALPPSPNTGSVSTRSSSNSSHLFLSVFFLLPFINWLPAELLDNSGLISEIPFDCFVLFFYYYYYYLTWHWKSMGNDDFHDSFPLISLSFSMLLLLLLLLFLIISRWTPFSLSLGRHPAGSPPFFLRFSDFLFFSLATMRPLISDLCTCTLPRAGRVSLTISSGWGALSPVYYLVAVACFVQKKKEKESRIVFL